MTELAKSLEKEGDIAADFLEELLDIADLDGDIDMDVDGDRAAVEIVGGNLDHLVGRDGDVLDALAGADPPRCLPRDRRAQPADARRRRLPRRASHRARRRCRRRRREGQGWRGIRVAVTAMTPFERKVVHDAVAAAGLNSASEGVEPQRYVVVLPAGE